MKQLKNEVYRIFKKYKKPIIALLLVFVLILVGRFISNVDFKELGKYLAQMPGMFVGVIVASFGLYIIYHCMEINLGRRE